MRRRASPRWVTCPNGHQTYARRPAPHAYHTCAVCQETYECRCQATASAPAARPAGPKPTKPAPEKTAKRMWWEP